MSSGVAGETSFANSKAAGADALVGRTRQPFWIEKAARKLVETNFVVSGMFQPFSIRDGNLITCQQQFSGAGLVTAPERRRFSGACRAGPWSCCRARRW